MREEASNFSLYFSQRHTWGQPPPGAKRSELDTTMWGSGDYAT